MTKHNHEPEPASSRREPQMSTHAKIIKHKVGLLHLAEALGNVSQACKVMGYSRDTFYRYQQAVEDGGVEALIAEPPKRSRMPWRIGSRASKRVPRLAAWSPMHAVAQ